MFHESKRLLCCWLLSPRKTDSSHSTHIYWISWVNKVWGNFFSTAMTKLYDLSPSLCTNLLTLLHVCVSQTSPPVVMYWGVKTICYYFRSHVNCPVVQQIGSGHSLTVCWLNKWSAGSLKTEFFRFLSTPHRKYSRQQQSQAMQRARKKNAQVAEQWWVCIILTVLTK